MRKKIIFIAVWLIVMFVSGNVLYDAYLYFTLPRAKFVKVGDIPKVILYHKKFF